MVSVVLVRGAEAPVGLDPLLRLREAAVGSGLAYELSSDGLVGGVERSELSSPATSCFNKESESVEVGSGACWYCRSDRL